MPLPFAHCEKMAVAGNDAPHPSNHDSGILVTTLQDDRSSLQHGLFHIHVLQEGQCHMHTGPIGADVSHLQHG